MADEEIATLAREAPHDPMARYRWRCALVRAGRGAEAGFEEGDEVRVGPADWKPEDPVSVWTDHVEAESSFVAQDGNAYERGVRDRWCQHRQCWTLLTPAKPKGDPS